MSKPRGFKARIKWWIWQVLVALDQTINALVFFGWADETLSARSWRKRDERFWGFLRWFVDLIFFWEKNHCLSAYEYEQEGKHRPKEYRPSDK